MSLMSLVKQAGRMDAPPCESCPHFTFCGKTQQACERFYGYVKEKENGGPSKRRYIRLLRDYGEQIPRIDYYQRIYGET